MNKNLEEIFTIFNVNNPNPRTELIYSNQFTLLIAIILSAQTTDRMVNKITRNLFAIADNPADLLKLGEENLKNHISSLGLYRNKSKNIIATCELLITQGTIPNNLEDLIKLPGVGRKTANVFLNNIYGAHAMGVDTHVLRVANRLGIIQTNNVVIAERELIEKINDKWLRQAHDWLVLHGRYICKAKKPFCKNCPVKDYCPSRSDIIN